MKKQLFLSCLVAVAFTGFAQESPEPVAGTLISPEILNELNHQSLERLNAAEVDRDAINGWVSFEQTQYNYTYGPDAFYTYAQIVTPDSLPRVSFPDGVYRSFIHGFGQIFDPTAEDMGFSDAQLTLADGYEIDSIGFPGFYSRVNHNDIDDTLIITVAVTDKMVEPTAPYDGSFWWAPGGLLSNDIYVNSPSYEGSSEHGNHHGLTGVSDPASHVEIQQYKFALTEEDIEGYWYSFPVNVVAGPDQLVYTFVEFQTSFEATIEDTAFVFDGAVGEANTNSFRTIYDYPVTPQTGYFFDLYREDLMSHNCSYAVTPDTRYGAYTGDLEWRNHRLEGFSWWGFRFEYYMNAVSSVSIDEDELISGITVFPNPVAGESVITVQLGEEFTGKVEIHNLDGRLVYSGTIANKNQFMLNLEENKLGAGTYVLSIENSEKVMNERFIVQ